MKKVDMIVKAPHFYTMEGEGVGYKNGVVMLVDGGKIVGFADEKQYEKSIKLMRFLRLTIMPLCRVLLTDICIQHVT